MRLDSKLKIWAVKLYDLFGKNPNSALIQFNPMQKSWIIKLERKDRFKYYQATYKAQGQAALNKQLGLRKTLPKRLMHYDLARNF
jgi:hypothetical protein